MHVLWMSIVLMKESGCTLNKKTKSRSKWYLMEIITNAEYVDDLALLSNTLQVKSVA